MPEKRRYDWEFGSVREPIPDTAARASHGRSSRPGADVLYIAESRHTLEDVYLELVEEDVEGLTR